MKKIIKINATILHVSNEQVGKRGRYFIIRTKGDDGKKYDVLPSSDTEEYNAWKELVKDGIGNKFEGFQYQGEGKYGGIFNKHILPYKLEEEKPITNTLL